MSQRRLSKQVSDSRFGIWGLCRNPWVVLVLAFFFGMLTHMVISNLRETQRASIQNPIPRSVVPRNDDDDPNNRMIIGEFDPVQAILVCSMIGEGLESQMLVDIVKALHQKVRVIILLNSPGQVSLCRVLLSRSGIPPGGVDLLQCNANSIWIRDYGPIFVREASGNIVAVKSTYRRADDPGIVQPNDEFAIALSNQLHLDIDGLPILLDGGNIVSNGRGLVYTTSQALSANRARGFDGKQLARLFRRKFGDINWIMTPPLRDEPTGHADIFLTFLAPDKVVVGRMDSGSEPENAARLDELATVLGRQRVGDVPLTVYRVPLTRKGEVWRSYCNIVVVNNTILVPSFADSPDSIEAEVMSVYREAMPNADIVAIPCDSLLGYDGLLHCMTLTLPRGIDLETLGTSLIPCP